MSQLSFFSAESTPPAVDDLAGLLAAPGQVVIVAGGARVSVVVDRLWRAQAIADMIADCGITPEIADTDEGHPLVRSVPTPDLLPTARSWTRGAVKAVPVGWTPGPRALRAWALASGRLAADGSRFAFGLDPHAPDTHPVLAESLMRVGIAPTLAGARGSTPELRVTGRRRLGRLVDTVGEAPPGVVEWPTTP